MPWIAAFLALALLAPLPAWATQICDGSSFEASEVSECSKSFNFSGSCMTVELYPGWGKDVVWGTAPWETYPIMITGAKATVRYDNYTSNFSAGLMVGNSYVRDAVTPNTIMWSAPLVAILSSEHYFHAGAGMAFPADTGAALPAAPHLDVHSPCSVGTNYNGSVTVWYRPAR